MHIYNTAIFDRQRSTDAVVPQMQLCNVQLIVTFDVISVCMYG